MFDRALNTPEKTRKKTEKDVAYFSKNQFGFGLVYEKETDIFIGQAGLMHLEYDEDQPRIEIGYRLHKADWNRGYATELAKNLLEWGFQNLSVDQLRLCQTITSSFGIPSEAHLLCELSIVEDNTFRQINFT